MADVNKSISKKRGRGRPRKDDAATTIVPVQLSKATVANLDRWSKDNAIGSRSGAIRLLVETGLALASPPPKRKPKGKTG
jgi:hypothetical protein